MRFSIIVPVFNVEEYLRECLESIIKQDFNDYEVLLIDDGSKDLSGTICEEFASRDARFKVFHKENGGSTSARKIGAINATGEYILCIDSDDYIEEKYLYTINSLLESNPDMLCVGYKKQKTDIKNCIKNGTYKGIDLFAKYFIDLSKPFPNVGNIIYGIVTKAVKSKLFIESQLSIPNSVVFGEDMLLSGLILKEARTVIIDDYCGYIYRVNDSSLTNTYDEKMIRRFTSSCDEFIKYFEEEKVFWFALSNLFNIYALIAFKSKNYKEFKKELEKVNYCKSLKEYSNKAKANKPDLKSIIKIFFDRHNLYRMMYLLYRR